MDPASPDARLANYRIDRLLGAGGMGSVYLAQDLVLERAVAIKFIAPDKAADLSARRRLIHEARAVAALDHPNICVVHEVIDEPGGQACIVMQYVEGETLADLLHHGRLDVRFALTLAADLAAALSAAHKRNIVHRDLKPQNIIVTPERRAKLLDFGIARYAEASEVSGDASTGTHLTGTGGMAGTPAYMSPEQIHGRPLDGRSDLFSLGAVLFECLTGQRAFAGANSMELAGEILGHHPPPVSSLRPELGEQHDELCRRLLAKDREDRFSSADELLGALRVLLPDTGRTGPSSGTGRGFVRPMPRSALSPRAIALAAVVVIVLAAVGWWQWRPAPISPADPKAADWYRRGIEAIRDGSPHSARLALTEAIRTAPDFAPAYIRLAEAETELDDADSAQQALLQVNALVERSSRLSTEDRTRVQAVRALMLRDMDGAVRAYSELASRSARDPGAWLDLGRAQEASALRNEALASYEQAIQINDQFPPAHLRRGAILGLEGRRDEALGAFAQAERLYRASANVEGEVETLIARGKFLNGANTLREARADLERASQLAGGLQSRAQQIRAQLALSSVTASEGRWDEAELTASAAVDAALRAELESVAADGLIDLANVLLRRGKGTEADAHLVRAIELADKRRARLIAARATLQRASIMVQADRPAEGIAAAKGTLGFFRANRYRRYEAIALSVMARGHDGLRQYPEARALADQALRTATEIKDDGQAAEALENLAGSANALGDLPGALDYRGRGLDIHRRQNELSVLAYDLVNRADLLIRLGRHAEGLQLLDEIDAGVAKQLDAFLPRARRARLLRALSAAIQQRPDEVRRYAAGFPPGSDGSADSLSQLAESLVVYAGAAGNVKDHTARLDAALNGPTTSAAGRELRYWDLAARLARGDARTALAGAETTLKSPGADISYEFEWRVAAIGAAAARRMKEVDRERVFTTRAQAALSRLRHEWKSDVASYEARPDLAELRRKAGLNPAS